MQLIQFDINSLDCCSVDAKDVEYKDIIDYEVTREAVCSLIFALARQAKIASHAEQQIIKENQEKLTHIRENLQIHDAESMQKILAEIVLIRQKLAS
ncbi:hypothetical protein [Acinetobacter populi]|uniref:Uncharacterized protein n=1 Tax=Acinetobacter populi TaxID=1582270 RepID=A0A1Z9YTF4_9GAMM|nr:hypothetical protein [Acinetobacter populi]OUY05506.1 hypothetical protein CAP51_16990 [Acinetobacter populi]